MPMLVTQDMVDPCTRALLGGIDVDEGATNAQLAVLGAVVAHLWEQPEFDPAAMTTLEPDAAASRIVDPAVRRRLIELLVTLELCRHPQTASQISRVESYAAAFEIDGPALEIVRRWIDERRRARDRGLRPLLRGGPPATLGT